MRANVAKAVVVAMILGCSPSAPAKRHGRTDDPLTRKTFNAPVESVYTAAVAVAGKQWQLMSSDAGAHTLTFDTTNTRLETAEAYSTYSVSVACVPAAPGAGTAVRLEVTEHASSQPSFGALVFKSQRRTGVLQDFWDGVEEALKEAAPPAPQAAVQSPRPAVPAAQPEAPASAGGPPQTPTPAAQPSQPPATVAQPTPAAAEGAVPVPSESAGTKPAAPTAPAPSPEPPTASGTAAAVSTPKAPKPVAGGELAAVTINSTPEGADITIDGKFFGDTPTTARLAAGDYVISIEKIGFKPWKRTTTLTAGGSVTLDATLEATK
jgi:hypothetical protein